MAIPLAAAILLLTVALSPLVVVAGEQLRRYVLTHPHWPGWYRVRRPSGPSAPVAKYSYGPAGAVEVSRARTSLLMVLVSNPLLIVLTAPPGGWQTGSAATGAGVGLAPAGRGARTAAAAPGLPAGAVSLAEPRTGPVIARLFGTAVRGLGRRDDRDKSGHQHRGRRAGTRRRNDRAC